MTIESNLVEKNVQTPLTQFTDIDSIENAVIFISDSFRYDHLPTVIADLGITAKTTATSTGTSASLPSITSGKYPSNHQIWSIYDQSFSKQPELLEYDHVGYDAETSWPTLSSENKPTLKVHNLSSETKLKELSEPFVHIIHDFGPHYPYDRSYRGAEESFFKEFSNKEDSIKNLYEDRAFESCERFLDVYREIEDKGILEHTLVVFTSDHGELLGEHGGQFGHPHPLVPELIHVPTVFTGAGIDCTGNLNHQISSTDIAPTVMGAQSRDYPDTIDGNDLWNHTSPQPRNARTEVRQHTPLDKIGIDLNAYSSVAVSNSGGTLVYNKRSSYHCYGWSGYFKLFKETTSPVVRRNITPQRLFKILRTYKPGYVTYGSPNVSKREFSRHVRI